MVTDDAEKAAAEIFGSDDDASSEQLPTVEDLLAAPFVLIGTTSEIARKLLDMRTRWGFSRYTVREGTIDAIADVMRFLDDADSA